MVVHESITMPQGKPQSSRKLLFSVTHIEKTNLTFAMEHGAGATPKTVSVYDIYHYPCWDHVTRPSQSRCTDVPTA